MAALMPEGKQSFNNSAGAPLIGGKLYTYDAGTGNPRPTYQDAAATTPNTNPVVMDARGEATIFWSGSYKIVLKDASDVTIWTVDNAQASSTYTDNLRSDLADDTSPSKGAGLSGFNTANAYPIKTLGRKAKERVTIEDYLTTLTPSSAQVLVAFQTAIDSGAKRVAVVRDYTINGSVTLAPNQIIDFEGGSLTVDAGTAAPNGVLYGNAKAGVRIIDPFIDCTSTTGLAAVNIVDCPSARVEMGLLVKSNLVLQSTNAATRMGYKIRGCVVNCLAYATTGVYISAVKGVNLTDVEVFNGKEGFGVYNGSTNVKHSGCESYGHTQDGFVLISGTQISYSGCFSYSNGQSGFTTQRQTAGSNVLNVTYSSCEAYSNAYDGFDIRGANAASWSVPMRVSCVGCLSYSNSGTGFYVVYAEGTSLVGCIATQNTLQGFFMNGSSTVSLAACQSHSNASGVGAGTSKAGIHFQDSAQGSAVGCLSTNSIGATQSYGISFTGSGGDCSVAGGFYQNNTIGPINNPSLAYVSAAAIQSTGNVWVDSITGNSGAYSETGFGIPAHSRTKGSIFRRTDGASGEMYMSNGGGSWTQVVIP